MARYNGSEVIELESPRIMHDGPWIWQTVTERLLGRSDRILRWQSRQNRYMSECISRRELIYDIASIKDFDRACSDNIYMVQGCRPSTDDHCAVAEVLNLDLARQSFDVGGRKGIEGRLFC